MQLQTTVVLLSISVIIHSFFGIASLITIITYSFSKNLLLFDILSSINVLSLLIFKKCLAVDIYECIRGDTENLPDIAKDNFLRNKIVSLFKDNSGTVEDFTQLRLDKIDNLTPLINSTDTSYFTKMYNRKHHYLLINIILMIILLTKYNMKKFIPLIIIWIFTIFPLE